MELISNEEVKVQLGEDGFVLFKKPNYSAILEIQKHDANRVKLAQSLKDKKDVSADCFVAMLETRLSVLESNIVGFENVFFAGKPATVADLKQFPNQIVDDLFNKFVSLWIDANSADEGITPEKKPLESESLKDSAIS